MSLWLDPNRVDPYDTVLLPDLRAPHHPAKQVLLSTWPILGLRPQNSFSVIPSYPHRRCQFPAACLTGRWLLQVLDKIGKSPSLGSLQVTFGRFLSVGVDVSLGCMACPAWAPAVWDLAKALGLGRTLKVGEWGLGHHLDSVL